MKKKRIPDRKNHLYRKKQNTISYLVYIAITLYNLKNYYLHSKHYTHATMNIISKKIII